MNERLLIAAILQSSSWLGIQSDEQALQRADRLIEAEKKSRAIPQPLPASASATEPPRH